MIFTVWTGRENAEDARASINAFAVPTRARQFKETHLGEASKAPAITGISEVQKGIGQNARRSFVPYDAGKWYRSVYDVQDGVVIKLTVQRKQSWSSMIVTASILLHARNEAAHQRIVVPLSGHEGMQFKMHEIDGRFDILTVEEAVQLGVKMPSFGTHAFDPSKFEKACTLTVIEPEISKRVKVRVRERVNAKGDTVQVAEPIRRRGIRID